MKKFFLAITIILAGCAQSDSPTSPGEGAPKLDIVKATFGMNCRGFVVPPPGKNTVVPGNATEEVKEACGKLVNGRSSCTYVVHLNVIPDPAPTCVKAFDIKWRCGEQVQATHLDVSAEGAKLIMSCAPVPKQDSFVAHGSITP